MLPINRKGLHPYQMANRLFVLAFSNDPVPISLASQDRRWFAIWSTANRMDPSVAQKTMGLVSCRRVRLYRPLVLSVATYQLLTLPPRRL